LGLKRPGREAEHSPPRRAEVKDSLIYTFNGEGAAAVTTGYYSKSIPKKRKIKRILKVFYLPTDVQESCFKRIK
jgi:hypothetical protein